MIGTYYNWGQKLGHPGAVAGEACGGLSSKQKHLT